MIDVDRFKAINDRHGHAAGDTVLAAVATRCKEGLRIIDACGRVGGEEFVVVLPDTDASGAAVTAERLRKAVDEEVVTTQAGAVHVTVSIGIAVHVPGTEAPVREAAVTTRDAEALLRRADVALYRAKARGRNLVVTDAAPGTDCA
jgi:diguanylate cyclase (GGDEF)-like protein